MPTVAPMRTTGARLNADGWKLHCCENQPTRPPSCCCWWSRLPSATSHQRPAGGQLLLQLLQQLLQQLPTWRQCNDAVIWHPVSGLWRHTVGGHRCIWTETPGGVISWWNGSPCVPCGLWRVLMSYYAGAQWHWPTIFGLGFVSGTSGGQCVGHPIALAVVALTLCSKADPVVLRNVRHICHGPGGPGTSTYLSSSQISWCISFISKDKQCGSIRNCALRSER